MSSKCHTTKKQREGAKTPENSLSTSNTRLFITRTAAIAGLITTKRVELSVVSADSRVAEQRGGRRERGEVVNRD